MNMDLIVTKTNLKWIKDSVDFLFLMTLLMLNSLLKLFRNFTPFLVHRYPCKSLHKWTFLRKHKIKTGHLNYSNAVLRKHLKLKQDISTIQMQF